MKRHLSFGATTAELEFIRAIARRAALLMPDAKLLDLLIGLEACHCNGCPLLLEELAEAASDADLAHDVFGIMRHIDRSTGQLRDCFLPRYARRVPR